MNEVTHLFMCSMRESFSLAFVHAEVLSLLLLFLLLFLLYVCGFVGHISLMLMPVYVLYILYVVIARKEGRKMTN